jgi:copper homeostasis protein
MKIELCSAHIESLFLAEKFKFDRIELCQSLEVGGLTPSAGFQQMALKYNRFETHILIRHRAGDFIYSDLEKEIMFQDMKNSVEIGVHGLVVGALIKNNNKLEIDLNFLSEIKKQFPNIDLTFHRAFDNINDKNSALESLIDLNFNRVLTSGGNSPIQHNIEQLRKLKKVAHNKIELMIGGGINSENVKKLVEDINPDAIHFSGTVLKSSNSDTNFEGEFLVPSENKINLILNKLNSF